MDKLTNSKNKLTAFAALEPRSNKKDTVRKREATQKNISKCITNIMNTLSFRKLASKTQVILSLTGPDVRTRLTHTIEVAKIAKDICIKLGLNADLAEAVALAHDIGHTPFGHVGERTLREIMCGCDTLGDKINDCDFINSGFKHNLQSFRVLKELERVNKDHNGNDEYKNLWPFILWGALAHTKTSYAKPAAGMDDEILISSKHCDWVYVCHYHEKKECKWNIQRKKGKESENGSEICKPWFCAMLPIIKDKKDVKEGWLINNEDSRDYLKKEPIEEKYQARIFCTHKCYLAKLWKYKLECDSISLNFPYLFDHPFPNSFYAIPLNNYFENPNDLKDFISFEAQIVSIADEIAQRQQDLEDGVNIGLLSFIDAKGQVEKLIKKFDQFDDVYDHELNNIKTSEYLGKLLTKFYQKALIEQTKKNVKKFKGKPNEKTKKINKYSLMNILYEMDTKNNRKAKWILKELELLKNSPITNNKIKFKCIKYHFEIDPDPVYLYLICYDHLEKFTKRFDNVQKKEMLEIFSACIDLLGENRKYLDGKKLLFCCQKKADEVFCELRQELKKLNNNCEDKYEAAYGFIKTLNLLRHYLDNTYKIQSNDYFREKNKLWWKNIGQLNLRQFYRLYQIYSELFKDGKIVTYFGLQYSKNTIPYNQKEAFKKWKEVLKGDANRVISNLVSFIDEEDETYKKRKDALKQFENSQKNIILKSEAVEKNDGKASYILKKLFRAYITNSHQLPDLGLKYILCSLVDIEMQNNLLQSEQETFEIILDKLKKTMPNDSPTDCESEIMSNMNLLSFETDDKKFESLTKKKSNEIKAALKKRKKLSEYFKELEKECEDIFKFLNSEEEESIYNSKNSSKGKNYIKEQLRKLRAILDNPILNATPYWQSVLTRGICDYIASLTDQEAVNEYEKLYAGMMELI